MDLISEREARLLFRLTNFFNPQYILQLGAATAVESVAMLEVNHSCHLYLYDPRLEEKTLAIRVLQSQLDRVECYDNASVAVDDLLARGDEMRMVLVNEHVDDTLLKRLLDDRCVLVMRNLDHDEAMRNLYESCCSHMTIGQTYTNNKIAILIPNPKLQREDFLLWLI